jgi:hypothetical protein
MRNQQGKCKEVELPYDEGSEAAILKLLDT